MLLFDCRIDFKIPQLTRLYCLPSPGRLERVHSDRVLYLNCIFRCRRLLSLTICEDGVWQLAKHKLQQLEEQVPGSPWSRTVPFIDLMSSVAQQPYVLIVAVRWLNQKMHIIVINVKKLISL